MKNLIASIVLGFSLVAGVAAAQAGHSDYGKGFGPNIPGSFVEGN